MTTQQNQSNVIKGILISFLAPMENHISNGGEKLLGNASSIKRRPDEKVYISGQMVRHSLFSTMERMNESDASKGPTYVSNGDGISNAIEVDLRADLGGFMHPSAGNYSGRRISPVSVTPAVAINKSDVGSDLLIRLKLDTDEKSRDQALATKEYSQKDIMQFNLHLDISNLSLSRKFTYEKKDGIEGVHIQTECVKHVTENERKRRAILFLKSAVSMNDFAQQARNFASAEPSQILIVFDSVLSRKASRYFSSNEIERKNILSELDSRNAFYFLGDDSTTESVRMALDKASRKLNELNLFDPAGGDENIQKFADAFQKSSSTSSGEDPKKSSKKEKTK